MATISKLGQISNMIPPEVKKQWDRIPHKNALALGVIAGVGTAYFGYRWFVAESAQNATHTTDAEGPGGRSDQPKDVAMTTPPSDAPAVTMVLSPEKPPVVADTLREFQKYPGKFSALKKQQQAYVTDRPIPYVYSTRILGMTIIPNESNNQNIPVYIKCYMNTTYNVTLSVHDFITNRKLGSAGLYAIDSFGANSSDERQAKKVYGEYARAAIMLPCEFDTENHVNIAKAWLKAFVQYYPSYKGQIILNDRGESDPAIRQKWLKVGFVDKVVTPASFAQKEIRSEKLHLPEEARKALLKEVADNPMQKLPQ